uniref:C2H2-type domain-containing protein n=1 Tax=Macrostomum lignano TaxID=282301 RepID=A0A1I8FKV5_9PLAT
LTVMTSSNSASAFASIDLDSLLDEGGSASFQSALRQSELLFGDIERTSEQVSGVFRSRSGARNRHGGAAGCGTQSSSSACPWPMRSASQLSACWSPCAVGWPASTACRFQSPAYAGWPLAAASWTFTCRSISLRETPPWPLPPIACIECDLKFDRADAAVSHFQRLTSSGGRHQRYRVLLLCGQAGCGKLFTNYTSRIAHRSRVHGIVCHDRVAVAKCVVGPNSRLYQLIGRQLVDCGAYRDNGELPGPAVV